MKRLGLLEAESGEDRRARVVRLSSKGQSLCRQLETVWNAVHQAAEDLDRELTTPLASLLQETLRALEKRSFSERIRAKLEDPE
jgi:DNA-binding MarR family transcriptional regulator